MQDLSQQQWTEKMENDPDAVIVDVRTPFEIEQGYIPDALHINIQDAGSFMHRANELDKSKSYYIYCRSGGRSKQACLILNSLGFGKTYNLLGGFEQWQGDKTV
jgi:rhodanese-related sulfurtransferase